MVIQLNILKTTGYPNTGFYGTWIISQFFFKVWKPFFKSMNWFTWLKSDVSISFEFNNFFLTLLVAEIKTLKTLSSALKSPESQRGYSHILSSFSLNLVKTKSEECSGLMKAKLKSLGFILEAVGSHWTFLSWGGTGSVLC